MTMSMMGVELRKTRLSSLYKDDLISYPNTVYDVQWEQFIEFGKSVGESVIEEKIKAAPKDQSGALCLSTQ